MTICDTKSIRDMRQARALTMQIKKREERVQISFIRNAPKK
jgi:hypothetical protein